MKLAVSKKFAEDWISYTILAVFGIAFAADSNLIPTLVAISVAVGLTVIAGVVTILANRKPNEAREP